MENFHFADGGLDDKEENEYEKISRLSSWKEKQLEKCSLDTLATLSCEYCPFKFRLQPSLEAHVKSKHKTRCINCKLSFHGVTLLERHLQNEHSKEEADKNQKVSKEIDEKVQPSQEVIQSLILQKVSKSRGKILLQCKECDVEYSNHASMVKHVKVNHLKLQKFECVICQPVLTFAVVKFFRKHMETEHGIKHMSKKEKNAEIDRKIKRFFNRDSNGQPILRCKGCKKDYPNLVSLERHIRKSHVLKESVICDLCGKNLSKNCLREHKLRFHGLGSQRKKDRTRLWEKYGEWINNETRIKCKVCSIDMIGLFSTLRRHVEDCHERDFRYHCEKCGHTFYNKANFKTHMVKNHKLERHQIQIPNEHESVEVIEMAKKIFRQTDDERLLCIECNKTYHKRFGKHDHVKRFHLNIHHMCRKCGDIFTSNDLLTDHLLKEHTDQSFNINATLVDDGESPEVIEMANKIFKTTEDGQNIMCIKCNKTYRKKHSKIQHVKLYHINVQPKSHIAEAIFKSNDKFICLNGGKHSIENGKSESTDPNDMDSEEIEINQSDDISEKQNHQIPKVEISIKEEEIKTEEHSQTEHQENYDEICKSEIKHDAQNYEEKCQSDHFELKEVDYENDDMPLQITDNDHDLDWQNADYGTIEDGDYSDIDDFTENYEYPEADEEPEWTSRSCSAKKRKSQQTIIKNQSKSKFSSDLIMLAETFIIHKNMKLSCKFCPDHHWRLTSKHLATKHVINNHLSCDFCKETFESTFSEHLLEAHGISTAENLLVNLPEQSPCQKFVSNTNPLLCKICNTNFQGSIETRLHVAKYHLKAKIFTCEKCSKEFITSGQHLKHLDQCKKWPKPRKESEDSIMKKPGNTGSKHLADKYFRVVEESDRKMFKCNQCGELLLHITILSQHLRHRHGLNPGDHVCDICGKTFMQIGTLRSHIKSQHRPTDEKVSKSIDASFKRCNTKFQCKICPDKIVDTKDEFRKHFIIIHLKEEPRVCEICGNSYTSQGLHIHKKEKHFSNKDRKTAFSNMDLEDGLKLFQNGLTCKKCGRKFKTEMKIQRHIKNTHLRQADFECNLCDLKFVNETSRAHHLFTIHNIRSGTGNTDSAKETDEKLLQIEFVKSNIAKAKTFEENGVVHFECPICQKVTMRSAGLRIHLRGVHLGIKSLECHICHKKFSSSGPLAYHINFTHKKSENPQERSQHLEIVRELTARAKTVVKEGRTYFQCEQCDRYLTGKQGLRLHLMNMHMINKK